MTQRKLQTLAERDIMQLKLLLKLRMASYETIKRKERKHIDHFHNALQTVKTIERHLQKELKLIEALRRKNDKLHKVKRWNVVHNTLKGEIRIFHDALKSGNDLVQSCAKLTDRLSSFQRLLKTAKRKPKEHELKTIKMFVRYNQ